MALIVHFGEIMIVSTYRAVRRVVCPFEENPDEEEILAERVISSYHSINSNSSCGRGSISINFQDVCFENSGDALKLCLFYFSVYISLSIIAYSFVFESWNIQDSIYFAMTTFTTVGYGDIYPTTEGGRLFCIFFALYGIVILGIFVGIIGHTLSVMQMEAVKNIELNHRRRLYRRMASQSDIDDRSQPKATLQSEVWEVAKQESPLLGLLTLVAVLGGLSQGFTVIQSIYFFVISFGTIGFGDLVPETEGMRVISIFLVPISAAIFGELIGRIASLYVRRKNHHYERALLNQSLTTLDLQAMDTDGKGRVYREQFITFMLLSMRKVSQEDVNELSQCFDNLDRTKSGFLSKDDLTDTSISIPRASCTEGF